MYADGGAPPEGWILFEWNWILGLDWVVLAGMGWILGDCSGREAVEIRGINHCILVNS